MIHRITQSKYECYSISFNTFRIIWVIARFVLFENVQNAIMAPHYNLNSHSVIYIIRGNGRLQIVGDYGQNVFDGQVQEGQALTVPQNFAVLKKAGNQGLEWVAFKTCDNAMINPLAGRLSTMRAIPVDVLMNSYRIDREEAKRLKFNREESTLFSSESASRRLD